VALAPTALVLRALGLGDLLAAVPALRGVRAALPAHRLVLATPRPLAPLARLSGAVDEVLPASGLAPLAWAGPPPDVAVNLHGRGPESSRLLLATRTARLVAFGHGAAGIAGPEFRADEHEVHRWCRLVAAGLGQPCDPDRLDLDRPGEPPAVVGAAVVHPGAAFAARRWPAERFAAVARHLAGRGLPVVVTGSAAEARLARAVAAAAGLPHGAVLAGATSVTGLAALVAAARVVVSGDTGVAHLATAYRTPSVVLFGPTPPALWGPPPRPQHVVLWRGAGRGNPWGTGVDPALLAVPVADVLAAVGRLLPPEGRPADAVPGSVAGRR
jgi:ADP-heptose:LPS heptosyltransferase